MISPLERSSLMMSPDSNNDDITLSNSTTSNAKKKKSSLPISISQPNNFTIGQIKEVRMMNFMCHKNFEIRFHSTPMQIVTGANGSGKSTIANAICLCLGVQARSTGRTSNVQSFIRNGEVSAELTIVLANEGSEAYKSELYGKEIQIVRKIGAKQSGYKILSEKRQVISTRKDTINEILQAFSISPENPLCILHQEVAKTFLLNNDGKKKYQFYMKVSQLDQMKQAYEEGLCTVQSIRKRIDVMREKHVQMLRSIEPFERQVKKIEIRRDQETRKHALEIELTQSRVAEAQQEIFNVQHELDQTQKSKDMIETNMVATLDQIREIEQRIEHLNIEKSDLEKDVQDRSGLQELNYRFSKEKREVELLIYRLTHECEKFHQRLEELKTHEVFLEKRINEFQNKDSSSKNNEDQRRRIDENLRFLRDEQTKFDGILTSLTDELNLKVRSIDEEKSTIRCVAEELKQKEKDFDEMKKLVANQFDVYGSWMTECLKSIENEKSFHQKPIGPIGRHIRCTNSRWSYAVEKHLAPIMSSFICTDVHDEKLLLDLFSRFATNYRPTIFVMKHRDKVHDVRGTLSRIRQANLLAMHQVLRIDNSTVECALIDFKQIEATILLEDLAEAKRIRQSGVLRWEKVEKLVKQVVEAWTHDGSNVKFDKAFRIYTNERQPAKYFRTNNAEALSTGDLQNEIQRLKSQFDSMNDEFRQNETQRKQIEENFRETKKKSDEIREKIKTLTKEFDRLNALMPNVDDFSLEELEEQRRQLKEKSRDLQEKFDETKEKKDAEHLKLIDLKENADNVAKKLETKKQQIDEVKEKLAEEQNKRHKIQQQIPKLTSKSHQFNEDIEHCHERLTELKKKQQKKTKTNVSTCRSVREIQQELDAIDTFLKSNEDTLEERRQLIEDFKIKRDEAQNWKKIIDRCERQVQRLENFIDKRKERFGIIADQHQYLLRHKFKSLMEKHHFDDCQIRIDHKNEELEIQIKQNRRSVASLSGGERSISTFCFLLALWESIYQPFRLLDEIDIYMDNEKRNSSLDLLYENTRYHSSSQHVIFTPQTLDLQHWEDLHVPIFRMPTPKRSLL